MTEIPPDDHTLRTRGSNQAGMGRFNERIVLQCIRLHGSVAKAEIARLTKLAPQTVQIIIKRLEAEGLVIREDRVRGRIGQPSVPMALNPDGAFTIGIKIGRRSLDVLLVDFAAQVRERLTLEYAYPDPDALFGSIRELLKTLRRSLGPMRAKRLHGVGIAAPLSLGGWQSLLGIDPAQARQWADVDIRNRVSEMTALPVELVKDTAAACVAELVVGRGRSVRSFLYIFIDTFIGGGLVIDSRLHTGPSGNSAAVGSMPLGVARTARAGAPGQLLSEASLFGLEARYAGAGLEPRACTDARALQGAWAAHTRRWLHDLGPAVAFAVNGAACLLELDGVIIDGSFSRELLQATLDEVTMSMERCNWEGVRKPTLMAGTIGSDARALGGALLPLYAHFAPDRGLFLKVD